MPWARVIILVAPQAMSSVPTHASLSDWGARSSPQEPAERGSPRAGRLEGDVAYQVLIESMVECAAYGRE